MDGGTFSRLKYSLLLWIREEKSQHQIRPHMLGCALLIHYWPISSYCWVEDGVKKKYIPDIEYLSEYAWLVYIWRPICLHKKGPHNLCFA